MITINNLQKNFGTTVASSIEYFEITDGEIIGLVGNNGAGKTTLFRLMLDLLKADSGFVTIDDINPSENEDWKQHVGAYIDEGFLIDFLTPEEYFAFLGKVSGMTKEQSEKRMEDFTDFAAGEIFGQKKLIRNLSAGNKQKVGIISALYRRPSIVILDEPFNFLDPSSQTLLKHLLTDYVAQTKATLLISSHNLQHTVDISTRIALLEHGCIIRDLDNKNQQAIHELELYFGS